MQRQKIKITMIYISFKNLLTKEYLNIVKVFFSDVIGCFIGVYNFKLLRVVLLCSISRISPITENY